MRKYDNPCCRGHYTFNALDPAILDLLERLQRELIIGKGGRVEFLLALLLQPDIKEKLDWVTSLQYAAIGASDAHVPVVCNPNIDNEASSVLFAEDLRELSKLKK
jgi:hypothetical protein